MSTATECPALVPPYKIVNNVLTNNSTLQVSTTQTSVGTQVNLSCKFNYTLVADNPVTTCQNDGTWNFSKDPACILPAASTGLTEDQKIILAVAGGVGGIVLIILLVMVCLICRKKQEKKKLKGLTTDAAHSSGNSTVPNDDFLGPPMDQYQYPPRPDYGYDDGASNQGRKNSYAPQAPYSQRRFDNPAFVNDHGPDPRRQYPYEAERRLERSYRENPPVVDYDREYFGGRPTPRDPRDQRDVPRNPITARPQFTNSVRMYEEYGRPSRVGMLEEAYALQFDNRSPSSTMNVALRGMATSRSMDAYGGYRGGDPTRYNRY